MKRNLLLLVLIVAFVFAHPWDTQAKVKADPWDELWERYEAGEIRFAITVSEEQIADKDIPVDWTRKMIVEWLKRGWLVVEDGAQLAGDSGGDCHLIVRYDSRWCVEGPGPRRCCCSRDVQY